MNCLKNSRSVLSRLLRHRPHVAAPPTPPQSSASRYHYYASRVLRNKPAVSRTFPPPVPPQLARPRHYNTSPRWYHDYQWKLTAAVLIISGGVVAFQFYSVTVPYTNRFHLVVLPPSLKRQLGDTLFAQFKKEFGPKILPPLHPDSIRVRLIASKIVSAVHRVFSGHQRHAAMEDGLNWEVIVVKDDIVNAFCRPGGKIVVTTGLLNELATDAEVATVLGHEVGHVIARHAAEKITKAPFWGSLLVFIMHFIYMTDFIKAVSALLILYWFFVPFEGRMEIEADQIGLLLLAAAGYDPRVAPSVYVKLGQIGGDSASNNYLSTHPVSREKRAQLLSRASVMNEALELYREVTAGQGTEGLL